MSKTMDPVLSNFIIMCIASSIGGLTALIGAFGACCIKSRCTHIKSGCIECDRSVIDEDNEMYSRSAPAEPAEPPNRV
jgi:hypothetical protein